MLTDERIDHYRTFGYAVLRRHLRDDEADRLRREVKTAQRDAFGPRLDERSFAGGIPGHYQPMMSRQRTPISLAMIEDERFLGAAGELVGGRVLPPMPRASSTSAPPRCTTTPAQARRA